MTVLYNKPGIGYPHCDIGGEYLSNEFRSFMRQQGSDYLTTITDTAALNGTAERMNRTIGERTRALLFDAGLPETFWNFAALYAVYMINRSPTKALPNNMTPFEKLTGQKCDYTKLQPFGCVAHARTLTDDDTSSRSDKCIFLGYIPYGYKLMRLSDCRLLSVRSARFEPTIFFKDLTA